MRNFSRLPKSLFKRRFNAQEGGASTTGKSSVAAPTLVRPPPLLTEMQAIPGSTLRRLPVTGKRLRRSLYWQKRFQAAASLPWGWLTLGMGVGSCLMFFLMAAP